MAVLRYMGVPANWDTTANPKDLATLGYINLLLANNMTMAQVTTQINAALAPFATRTYADSQTANLATPAYVATQQANYVPFSKLGAANGVAILQTSTGKLAPAEINLASTQQWPKPFWSPMAYNTSPVSYVVNPNLSVPVPAQVYSVAVADPGYRYVLFCTGLVDSQVSADNGAAAQVFVRQGSPTGQIVAFGYGCAESYQGPSPGQQSSQAQVTEGGAITTTFTTITGLTPINNATYTTSLIGPYIQVKASLNNVTLSASIAYTGQTGGISTTVRIVTNSGTVIATGSPSTGGTSPATVSWTGNVTIGQLYGVQIKENGFGTLGTIQSGTFTFTPPTVTNSSAVDIIPYPFDQQLPITGATTLYVMLTSIDGVTPVTASTFDPALWAMPIPWASVTSPTHVTLDSASIASNGNSGHANQITWLTNIGPGANCLIVGVGTFFNSGNSSTWTRQVTAGGVVMTSLGVQSNNAANATGWGELFVLMNPPDGPIWIVVTEVNGTNLPFITGCSVAYQAVGTPSAAVFGHGSSVSASTASIASTVGGTAVGLLVANNNAVFTAIVGNDEADEPATATTNIPAVMLIDAPGTGSGIILNGTTAASRPWSTIGINLPFV